MTTKNSDAVDRLIVFHAEIHGAFMLVEKNHRCEIDDALDYISKLEEDSQPSALEALRKDCELIETDLTLAPKEGHVLRALNDIRDVMKRIDKFRGEKS